MLLLSGGLILASPGGALAAWSSEQTIPSTTSGFFGVSAQTVGLADDGGAVVVWNDGNDTWAATRESLGGAWTKDDVGPDVGNIPPPMVAMNANGDAVLAWVDAAATKVAYRPDGGIWELASFDDGASSLRGPSVAINTDGDAIVVWLGYDGDTYNVRAVRRTKAGPWPSPGTNFEHAAAVSDPPTDLPGGAPSKFIYSCVRETAVSLDDSGRAIAFWNDLYGSFHDEIEDFHDQLGVCGLRSVTRTTDWGSTVNLTGRPSDGTYSRTGGTGPTAGPPRAAFDPVSGKVIVAFGYNASAIVFEPPGDHSFSPTGNSTGVARGTVAGPMTHETTIAGSSDASRPHVGAAAGFESIATLTTGNPGHAASGDTTTTGGGFSPALMSTHSPPNLEQFAAFTDAGGDGTGFFAYNAVQFPLTDTSIFIDAWTRSAGGGLSGPTRLFQSPNSSTPLRGLGIAANCRGDAFAAVGYSGDMHFRDYDSGKTVCGPSNPATPADPAPNSEPNSEPKKKQAKKKCKKTKGKASEFAVAAKKRGCSTKKKRKK